MILKGIMPYFLKVHFLFPLCYVPIMRLKPGSQDYNTENICAGIHPHLTRNPILKMKRRKGAKIKALYLRHDIYISNSGGLRTTRIQEFVQHGGGIGLGHTVTDSHARLQDT